MNEYKRWNPSRDFEHLDAIEYLERILRHVSKYAHVYKEKEFDYFLLDLAGTYPSDWTSHVCDLDLVCLADIVNGVVHGDSDDSLNVFVSESMAIQMPRSFDMWEALDDLVRDGESDAHLVHDHALPKEYSLGMNMKKIHEVNALSYLVSSLNAMRGVDRVIDIGSGKGYLSYILSYFNRLDVIGVEGETNHSESARAWGNKLIERLDFTEAPMMETLNFFIDSDIDIEKFENQVLPHFPDDEKEHLFSIVGLHACGNLTPTSLKLFCEWDKAKTLAFVSCCYLAMDRDGHPDFPMSMALKNRINDYDLGDIRDFLRLGTYTPSLIKMKNEQELELEKNQLFYRSILQLAIKTYYPNIPEFIIKRLNARNDFISFENYIEKVVTRLTPRNPENRDIFDEIKSSTDFKSHCMDMYNTLKPRDKEVLFRSCLQNVLAPTVESLLTLDRWFYLEEHQNIQAYIVPLFNETISPRNLSLLAVKE